MTEPETSPQPTREERHNGLSSAVPNPDQTILVGGGAGYIGCVLVLRPNKKTR